MKRVVVAGGLTWVGLIATTPSASASIVFDFNFGSGLTSTQQNAVTTAGNLFSTMFGSYFTNSATLKFDVSSINDGVAGAGSAGIANPGFGNGEVVRNKVVNGIDLNGDASDGFLAINFAQNWQLDPNAPVKYEDGELNFFATLTHEFTHALGFGSNIPADGIVTASYTYAKWDQFLTDQYGNPVVDPATGLVNLAAYQSAQTVGGLFNGPNANALWGSPVPLVASTDISHLNSDVFSTGNPKSKVTVNALMLCCGNPNDPVFVNNYDSAEVGILADLGYTLRDATTPVPEPASWSLVIGGVGICMIGAAQRRRKAVAEQA